MNFTHLISNKEKLEKDFAYYRFYSNKYRHDNNMDFQRMHENYVLANGDIDESMFKNIYQPFGPNVKLPTQFRHKDIVSSSIKRVVGIATTRKFKNRLVAINKEAVNRRREVERSKLSSLAVNQVTQELEKLIGSQIPLDQENRKQLIDQEVANQTPDSIKKYMRKQHVDPAEKIANHIKNYTLLEQDVDTTLALCSYDAAVVGKYLFYVGIEQEKAVFKRIDPRCFTYSRTTNSPFVKDFDQGTLHLYLSPAKIQEYWGNVIDKAKLSKIFNLVHEASSASMLHFDATEPSSFNNPIRYNSNTDTEANIYVSHSIWRSSTKKGILRYVRNEVEDIAIVDEEYIFNKDIGDISIEWKDVPELHECIMAGSDIIIKCGPVEGQVFDIDNLYVKDLPFYGCLLNSYDSECKGLIDYQKQYAALYDIILYRVEDFMAKDKGKLIFMHQDMLSVDIDKFLGYAEKNNIAFYGTQNIKNVQKDVSNLVKEVDRSQIAKINQYIDLANYIELKVKTVVGINPQFEGEIQEREGQRNVERAVGATSLALEPMFYLMDVAKNQAIKALTYNQIICFIRNNKKHISYVLDDVGLLAVDIDKDMLIESQFYMFMEDGSRQQKIIDVLTQYAAGKAQTDNLQLSALGRFLQEDDLNSALDILADSEEIKFKQDSELEAQRSANVKNELAIEAANNKELKMMEHDNDLLQIDRKGEWDVIKATVVGSGFAEDKDTNNNNVPDIMEIANQLVERQKLQHQMLQDKIKNKQDDRKLDIESKKVDKMSSKPSK